MKTPLLLLILASTSLLYAQQSPPQLYDPKADAAADLRKAISIAADEHKQVFVQVGGNWCSWCKKFDKLISSDPRIDSIMNADYVLVRVNYSTENKNDSVMARLGYPDRFGFPVFVILDSEGNRMHTQDSGLLETGDHHDPTKVLPFLKNWTRSAVQGPAARKK